MEESEFNNAYKVRPVLGSIVQIKIKLGPCSCSGHQYTECYYDKGVYLGIRKQSHVVGWRYSPANDLITELTERRKIIAKDCAVCV